ncbi:MAG: hypothetical protein WCT29_02555 [Candidatus Paceibacterota bacterium]|jgi:hypothetical protein
MKLELLKRKKIFKKGGFHTNPNVGWQIIVVVAVGIVAAFFASGFYLFIETNNSLEAPEFADKEEVNVRERTRLEKVMNYFSEQEQKSLEIINSPAQVVDPSR